MQRVCDNCGKTIHRDRDFISIEAQRPATISYEYRIFGGGRDYCTVLCLREACDKELAK